MKQGYLIDIIRIVGFNFGKVFGMNESGIIELGMLEVIQFIQEIFI